MSRQSIIDYYIFIESIGYSSNSYYDCRRYWSNGIALHILSNIMSRQSIIDYFIFIESIGYSSNSCYDCRRYWSSLVRPPSPTEIHAFARPSSPAEPALAHFAKLVLDCTSRLGPKMMLSNPEASLLLISLLKVKWHHPYLSRSMTKRRNLRLTMLSVETSWRFESKTSSTLAFSQLSSRAPRLRISKRRRLSLINAACAWLTRIRSSGWSACWTHASMSTSQLSLSAQRGEHRTLAPTSTRNTA